MTTSVSTISNTTTSTQVAAANARRSSLRVVINGSIEAYLLQGSGTASATNRTFTLDEFALPGLTITGDEAKEAFQVVFASSGSGSVVATQTLPATLSGGAASYPLLTIIREACDLLGLTRPAVVITSTDTTIRQLFAIAVEEARELAKFADWQSLRRECTFTTVADAEQEDAVPSDLRKFIPNSFFNRTSMRPVIGPVTPQQWQMVQAQPAANRVILAWRQRDGSFLMTPTPAAGETIAYEYITTEWAISSDETTTYTRWNADTDLTYLPAELIIMGIRWRWKKTKGLPYAEDFDTYTAERERAKSENGGATSISVTRSGYYRTGAPIIPEGNFGP